MKPGEQKEVRQIGAQQEEGQLREMETQSTLTISPAEADAWIGRELTALDGQKLGTITKAYSSEDGNSIRYLLVKGEKGRVHPVPVELVEANAGQQGLTAYISKEEFEGAPGFGENDVPRLTEQGWTEKIESHYGISPAWQDTTDQPDQSMMMDQQDEEQYQQKNMGEEDAQDDPDPVED